MRTCRKCNKEKDESRFYFHKKGPRYTCVECQKAYAATEETRKKINARYHNNRAFIRKKRNAHYRELSPEQKNERGWRNKISRWRREYNLEIDTYIDMLYAQLFKCACCARPFGRVKDATPCIDHDHNCCPKRSCGKCVRALLCRQCNRLVGVIESSPHLLNYIRRQQCQQA